MSSDKQEITDAVAAAAIGAARAVDSSPTGGITGFQASFIMWEFGSIMTCAHCGDKGFVNENAKSCDGGQPVRVSCPKRCPASNGSIPIVREDADKKKLVLESLQAIQRIAGRLEVAIYLLREPYIPEPAFALDIVVALAKLENASGRDLACQD